MKAIIDAQGTEGDERGANVGDYPSQLGTFPEGSFLACEKKTLLVGPFSKDRIGIGFEWLQG